MATGQQLADTALALARRYLAESVGELTQLAAGDTEALLAAARIVRATNTAGPEAARTAEHIAFSLLTAAYTYRTQASRLSDRFRRGSGRDAPARPLGACAYLV